MRALLTPPKLHFIKHFSMETRTQPEEGSALRVLGLAFGLAVTVGETIGVGIFRAPGMVAGHLDRFWPVVAVWVAGGVFGLLGVNALAELGTLMPRSGGPYVFVRRALGEYPGFVVGWSDWLRACGTTAAVAIVIGEYTGLLIARLSGDGPMVAIIAILLFTVLQWRGVRSGARTQIVTSVIKVVALAVLAGACFFAGNRNVTTSALELDSGASLMSGFVFALGAVIVTYDGWSSPVYFAGETRDPGRVIPRAMFGGLLLVIVCYLILNVAFLRVVPLGTMAGQKLAAGVVAEQIFGPSGHTILRWVSIAALLSAVSSNLLLAPRVLRAMSADGLFSRHAADLNPGGTPTVALFLSSGLAVLFVLSGTFEQVLAVLVFFFVGTYALSFLSLFVLRRTSPDSERPWRAWGHPWTTLLALIGACSYLAAAMMHDVMSAMVAAFLLAVSVPVFFLARRREPQSKDLP